MLNFTEIIKEVKQDGGRLTELLQVGNEKLESDCLTRALMAAVHIGSHINVGKLIVNGALNIEEALSLSIEEKKHPITAVLLLAVAAIEGDRSQIRKLFGEEDSLPQFADRLISPEDIEQIQAAIRSGKSLHSCPDTNGPSTPAKCSPRRTPTPHRRQ